MNARTITSQREWVRQASCHGTVRNNIYDPFYDNEPGDQEAALALCATCPVYHHCFSYVMATEPHGARHGIWAGTTAPQRNRLAKEHKKMMRLNFQGQIEVADPDVSITELQEGMLDALADEGIRPVGDVQFEFFYDVHARRQYLRAFFETRTKQEAAA